MSNSPTPRHSSSSVSLPVHSSVRPTVCTLSVHSTIRSTVCTLSLSPPTVHSTVRSTFFTPSLSTHSSVRPTFCTLSPRPFTSRPFVLSLRSFIRQVDLCTHPPPSIHQSGLLYSLSVHSSVRPTLGFFLCLLLGFLPTPGVTTAGHFVCIQPQPRCPQCLQCLQFPNTVPSGTHSPQPKHTQTCVPHLQQNTKTCVWPSRLFYSRAWG